MKYLLVLAMATISPAVFSAPDQWTEKVKITEIYTGYKEGHFLFKTSGALINPAECTDANLYSVEPANADVQSILSLLLAAKMAGTDVKIAADGSRCGTSTINHLKNKVSVSRVGSF